MTDYHPHADTFKALSDDEATAALNDMAAQLCGSDRWVTDLAGMIGLDRRTVQMWKTGDRRPPDLALVALAALLDARRFRAFHAAFLDWNRMAAQLGDG